MTEQVLTVVAGYLCRYGEVMKKTMFAPRASRSAVRSPIEFDAIGSPPVMPPFQRIRVGVRRQSVHVKSVDLARAKSGYLTSSMPQRPSQRKRSATVKVLGMKKSTRTHTRAKGQDKP